MEFGGWEENRRSNLDWLMKAGDLTDVTIVVEAATFPAHRVVLAAHSDYFYRMFTCGMTESRNEDVKIQGIEPEVFQQVSSASKELGDSKELAAGAELHLHREGGDERGGGGEGDLLGRQHAADVRPRAADGESWLVRSLSYLPLFCFSGHDDVVAGEQAWQTLLPCQLPRPLLLC